MAFKISTLRGCLSEINEKVNIEKIKEKLKTCIYYLDTLATHTTGVKSLLKMI